MRDRLCSHRRGGLHNQLERFAIGRWKGWWNRWEVGDEQSDVSRHVEQYEQRQSDGERHVSRDVDSAVDSLCDGVERAHWHQYGRIDFGSNVDWDWGRYRGADVDGDGRGDRCSDIDGNGDRTDRHRDRIGDRGSHFDDN